MTGYIPTLEQIDELHRKIAPSKAAYELVHTHCVIVATIGCQIVRRQNALFKHDGSDGEPLKFSKKRYILHGLKGYEYLLDEGVDESIAQFCRNHTGVGLTREDVVRQELPLPPADYVPMNLEQEVVMYADKFHSKSVPPKFLQVEAYTARAERFGGENKQRWLDLVAKYGVPDIPALAEKYGMRMI